MNDGSTLFSQNKKAHHVNPHPNPIHFIIWLLLLTAELSAQLTIKIDAIPALPTMPNVYLAGNFNGWNPGLSSYELKKR